MSKIRLLIVILSLIITTGCTASKVEQAHESALLARSAYLAMERATGICHVHADYGERIYDFSLVLTLEQGETTQVLTAPTELVGISVTQSGTGTESRLVWEDLILETGDLDPQGLSPVTAVPLLLETLSTGYLEGATLKEQGVLVLYSRNPSVPVGQGREIEIWLNPEDYTLLGGEIFQDGNRIVAVTVENFIKN